MPTILSRCRRLPAALLPLLAAAASLPLFSCAALFLIPHTVKVVDETITLQPGQYRYYGLDVTTVMVNPRFEGSFSVSGGNQVKVYVMDSDDFDSWSTGGTVYPEYNSGLVSSTSFNVSLSGAGRYYVVYDNTFSSSTSKSIVTKVVLKYGL